MIWLLLLAPLVLGLMAVRYTFMIEKKKRDRDKKETEAQMKEFLEMLNKNKKNEN